MRLSEQQAIERQAELEDLRRYEDEGPSWGGPSKVTEVEPYVDNLESFSITTEGSMSFGWSVAKYGPPPAPGDVVRTYTHQGSIIHGVDLNGEPRWYLTIAEREQERQAWLADRAREKAERFAAKRQELDEQYGRLPEVFRLRIDRFRANGGPDWRAEYEEYEAGVCVDAARMAAELKTFDAIAEFDELPVDEQRARIPELAYDMHSGNTWGTAVKLAMMAVKSPAYVVASHAAIAPLVGCEPAGCPPVTEGELMQLQAQFPGEYAPVESDADREPDPDAD
jgi:hypothetical protein